MLLYKSYIKTKIWENTVIVVTPYPLLIYLMLKDIEEIKNTLFFFTSTFAKKININELNNIVISDKYEKDKIKLSRLVYKVLIRVLSKTKWRHISKSNIYCQDHIPIAYCLTGANCYNLIEDGTANYYIDIYKMPSFNKYKKLLYNFLYGPQSIQPKFGQSSFAKKILLSGLLNIPKELTEKVEIISLEKMWNDATKDKKKFILNVFGINDNITKQINKRDILILSTPANAGYTEAYLISRYNEIIKKYDPNRIVIKAHPRNNINLSKYFPNILVLNNPFPIELLKLMGYNFNIIYSHGSTAAINLSSNIKSININ